MSFLWVPFYDYLRENHTATQFPHWKGPYYMEENASKLPLVGIVVLDFANILAGPVASTILLHMEPTNHCKIKVKHIRGMPVAI